MGLLEKEKQSDIGKKKNGSGLICERKEFIALRKNTENSMKYYLGFPKMKIFSEKK